MTTCVMCNRCGQWVPVPRGGTSDRVLAVHAVACPVRGPVRWWRWIAARREWRLLGLRWRTGSR